MGCFDLYCGKCALPFTPFFVGDKKRTEWLDKAVFIHNGRVIDMHTYDDYGRFTLADPSALPEDLKEYVDDDQLDVAELTGYGSDAKSCYHTACVGRTLDNTVVDKVKKRYHGQHFLQKEFVADKSLNWLMNEPKKRAPSAYNLFVKEKSAELIAAGFKGKDLIREAAKLWQAQKQ